MSLRVGIIGTGAISHKHAQAYANIGYKVTVCTDINEQAGRQFAQRYGAQFLPSYEDVCRHPEVDFVDVCTFPDFRLQPLKICAQTGKHIQVQKPISTNLETAREMIETARRAGIQLGVVSQHRFDDSSQFLYKAIRAGRLGKILQADAYVKWYRTPEYYSRPIKGSWAVEGGGALINQAIHQVDVLRWLIGGVKELFGYWQLGALHKIESEDVVCAVLRYENGATGVIQ
ncbi:MAG: Gfo/Idh/MocA family protein, partial [Bryobacteraceae bacterium]